MPKIVRDMLIASGPLVIGLCTVAIKATTDHLIDPWLVGNAIATALLAMYLHFATSAAP